MTSKTLVEGVYRHRLVDHASEVLGHEGHPDRMVAERAIATCERIGGDVDRERDRILDMLRAHGIDVQSAGGAGPRQNHEVRLRVDEFGTAQAVSSILERDGFEPWDAWSGAALASFSRFATQLTVTKTADVSMVVRVSWGEPKQQTLRSRLFRPTAGDWNLVELPRWAWRAYSLVRPVRLVAERVGLRRRHHDSLGPFLSTPVGLLDLLLEFGAVTPDDVVADLGCGDGRLVVAAAQLLGCRSIGVDSSIELVERARMRAEHAGMAHLVRVEHGDARTIDLDDVDVVFMFLPVDIVGDLVGEVARQVRPGTRLIAHEQSRLGLRADQHPLESSVLVAPDGVTVAHRWTA